MGVVHKLSDEVRDFILAEKKALPQISCRKLSDVTYEKFQVIVSKSSISSVLKSAHLNSPIGRHSLSVEEEKIINQHKVKKFKIPEHKKSEIFSPPKPKERSVSNKNSLESAPKNPVLKNPTVKIPPQISVPITTVEKLPQVMSNLTINISSKKIPPVLQNEGVLVQNAGVIFIKAIEWILNGKSILGKVLNDEGVGRFNVQWEQVADIMLLANLVEQENISAVDFTTWKWIFNSSLEEKAPDLEIWKTSLEAAENIADCGIKLAIEFSILSQGIAYYKLIDQAGAVIYVNSQSKNIFFNNVQSEKEISFYSAITSIRKEVINNVQSAVFYCSADTNNIVAALNKLVALFNEKHNGALAQIVLCNSKNAELVKFDCKPNKKRIFVLAIDAESSKLPNIDKSFSENRNGYDIQIFDQKFVYKNCSNQSLVMDQDLLEKNPIQGIAISHSSTEKPFIVLLTNASAEPLAIKKIVLDFLLTWPGLGNKDNLPHVLVEHDYKDNLAPVSEEITALEQSLSFFQSIKALQGVLEIYCQKHFFGVNRLIVEDSKSKREIYRLPGFWQQEERACCLSFSLSGQNPLYSALKTAIFCFNSQCIFDPSGRRIILKITPLLNS